MAVFVCGVDHGIARTYCTGDEQVAPFVLSLFDPVLSCFGVVLSYLQQWDSPCKSGNS